MDQEDLFWFIHDTSTLTLLLKRQYSFDSVVKRNTLTFSFYYSNYLCPSNFWNFLYPKHVLTSFLSSLFIRRYFCKITSQLLNNTSLHNCRFYILLRPKLLQYKYRICVFWHCFTKTNTKLSLLKIHSTNIQ